MFLLFLLPPLERRFGALQGAGKSAARRRGTGSSDIDILGILGDESPEISARNVFLPAVREGSRWFPAACADQGSRGKIVSPSTR
jgi:hypothetical protein